MKLLPHLRHTMRSLPRPLGTRSTALQAGVKTLRLPAQNKKDVDELPAPAKKGLKIYTHKHIDEIIKVLFPKPSKRKQNAKTEK